MLDLVINPRAGISLVHDDPQLDGARALVVMPDLRCFIEKRDQTPFQTERRISDGDYAEIRAISKATVSNIRLKNGHVEFFGALNLVLRG